MCWNLHTIDQLDKIDESIFSKVNDFKINLQKRVLRLSAAFQSFRNTLRILGGGALLSAQFENRFCAGSDCF